MSNFVYRCYDSDGELLYIGASGDVAARLKAHSRSSAWHRQMASYETSEYPTYETALAAERAAIRQEQPPYNIRSTAAGSPRGLRQDPRRLVPHGRDLIRAHMTVRKLSLRDLSEMCGGLRYRTAIGHLLTGERDTCNNALAERIQAALLGADHPAQLFTPKAERRKSA